MAVNEDFRGEFVLVCVVTGNVFHVLWGKKREIKPKTDRETVVTYWTRQLICETGPIKNPINFKRMLNSFD